MTTALQAETSRQNGAQSTGPTTPEGKAKSSQNAARHGLCSGKLAFEDDEARVEFERRHQALVDTYIPTTEPEADCIRRMAEAQWRAHICTNMEFALLHAIDRGEACAMVGGQGLPSLNTILRYKSRIDRDYANARTELDDLRTHRLPPLKPKKPTNAPGNKPVDDNSDYVGTNEPSRSPQSSGLNREQRRRLQAITKKRHQKAKPSTS